jgi:hypothetical protein
MTSQKATYIDLRDALKNNPIRFSKDGGASIMTEVRKGGWILIQSSELMAITQYYGHCGLLEIEVRRF